MLAASEPQGSLLLDRVRDKFPLVTYDLGPVKVNAVYFPKIANYNEVAAFGLYVSVPLGQFFGDSTKSR